MRETASQGFELLRVGGLLPEDSSLVVRPVEATHGREVLLGLDVDGGRHLLVPYGMRVRPVRYGEVRLATRPLGKPPTGYLDLSCETRTLAGVFSQFIDVLIEELVGSQTDPYVLLKQGLDEWSDLFSTPGAIPVSTIIGLVGELETLKALAAQSPADALAAWGGPNGAAHDFMSQSTDLEVKTTTARDGGFIEIHGLDQLEPADVPLRLVVHRLAESGSAPTVDERVEELLDMGVPRRELLDKMEQLSHPLGASSLPENGRRFRVTESLEWDVDESFPGLRRSHFSHDALEGISHVTFRLDVAALPKARLFTPDAINLFAPEER